MSETPGGGKIGGPGCVWVFDLGLDERKCLRFDVDVCGSLRVEDEDGSLVSRLVSPCGGLNDGIGSR